MEVDCSPSRHRRSISATPELLNSSPILPTDQRQFRNYHMKGNLRKIGVIKLVGAATMAGLTLSAPAANVVSQELMQAIW